MQREDKQIESTIEGLILKLTELKSNVNSLLFKLEQERDHANWPSLLDNFALISGQFTAISKLLSHDKTAPLKSLTILPLFVSPDRDDELYRLTEGRVQIFNHDIVPDYLRTKPEPEVEKKITSLVHKANNISVDTGQKQSAAFNKAVNNVLDIISKARDDWDTEISARSGITQTSVLSDTHTLISAVSTGKELKPITSQGVTSGPPSAMVPPGIRPNSVGPTSGTAPGASNNPITPTMNIMGKNQPAVKTNVKSAVSYR